MPKVELSKEELTILGSMLQETLTPLNEHINEASPEDLKLIQTMRRLLMRFGTAYAEDQDDTSQTR
jgi:hypothetical protein